MCIWCTLAHRSSGQEGHPRSIVLVYAKRKDVRLSLLVKFEILRHCRTNCIDVIISRFCSQWVIIVRFVRHCRINSIWMMEAKSLKEWTVLLQSSKGSSMPSWMYVDISFDISVAILFHKRAILIHAAKVWNIIHKAKYMVLKYHKSYRRMCRNGGYYNFYYLCRVKIKVLWNSRLSDASISLVRPLWTDIIFKSQNGTVANIRGLFL